HALGACGIRLAKSSCALLRLGDGVGVYGAARSAQAFCRINRRFHVQMEGVSAGHSGPLPGSIPAPIWEPTPWETKPNFVGLTCAGTRVSWDHSSRRGSGAGFQRRCRCAKPAGEGGCRFLAKRPNSNGAPST
ncbi:MAG: hypothetical protein ACI8PT_002685, partial [Gammaproteobacteria bacterium]